MLPCGATDKAVVDVEHSNRLHEVVGIAWRDTEKGCIASQSGTLDLELMWGGWTLAEHAQGM